MGRGDMPGEKNEQSENKFTQEQLNDIISFEKKKILEKFADYEDLKKKVSDFSKIKEDQELKDLEAKKEYDKLKDNWLKAENQYKSLLSEKDNLIKEYKINRVIEDSVFRQNGYSDAGKLLREYVVYSDNDSDIKIKYKNKDGVVEEVSVDEGVKRFLSDRPYLVRASSSGNRGSGAFTPDEKGGANQTSDLASQLYNARRSGDYKKIEEIKNRIREKHKV
jgi:hypothetical protein